MLISIWHCREKYCCWRNSFTREYHGCNCSCVCAIIIFVPFINREDFERNGLSSLITVNVRDIQGEGFPEEHRAAADAVFLDLPQPWLAVPSVSLMLKQDGVLCSFSPCIEQVQRACEAMRSCFTGSVLSLKYFWKVNHLLNLTWFGVKFHTVHNFDLKT